jgi:hypothetical protein
VGYFGDGVTAYIFFVGPGHQHGTDINVLLERWATVAVISTQSQHSSRKKWWIDTTSCAGAIGWPHRCSALENIDRTALGL